jgi:hypothetical protein
MLPETLLLAALLGAGPTAAGASGMQTPEAGAPAVPKGTTACPLPVYLKGGEVRCADKPAAAAFGRVVWVEGGRPVSMPASRVDLERTMRIHQRAPRRGGFSVMGDGSPAPPSLVEQAAAEEAAGGEEPETGSRIYDGTEAPEAAPMTDEERKSLRDEMHRTVIELDILRKQYKALALSGIQPSNALGRSIHNRERRIREIKMRLAAVP